MRAAILLGALAACSFPTKTYSNGQTDAPQGTIDSRFDAPPDGPPAPPLGIIAALEVDQVTDADATNIGGMAGGRILVTFPGGTPGTILYGNPGAFAGCSVVSVAVSDPNQMPVDGGAMMIGGTAAQQPIGGCAFQAGAGYSCIPAQGMASVKALAVNSFELQFDLGPVILGGANYVGAVLETSGYTNAPFNGTFPIVGATDTDADGKIDTLTVVIGNGAPPAGTSETRQIGYKLIAGLGPVPDGPQFGTPDVALFKTQTANFPQTSLSIHGGGANMWPSIDFQEPFPGQGLKLAGAQPSDILKTPNDVTFTCDPTQGGSCGTAEPATAPGIAVMGVLAFTTDNLVASDLDFVMEPPQAESVAMLCVAAGNTLVVPKAAIDAIRARQAKRIQVDVIQGIAQLYTSSTGQQMGVVDGYAVEGHADFGAP